MSHCTVRADRAWVASLRKPPPFNADGNNAEAEAATAEAADEAAETDEAEGDETI